LAVASENVELVRRGIERFNAGVTLIDDVFAADAELWPAVGFPEGGPFKGHDEIRRFFEGLREGWKPGTAVFPREFEEAGDKVLVSAEWRAIGEASGVETSSDWMALYTFRDGRIVRLQFFADRDAAIEAAGMK
jgi:ketosteroid isomerase-like protein